MGHYDEENIVGIIGNSDHQLISMYVFNLLPTDALKKSFLSLGEMWWWESNRQLPINIFLGSQWSKFNPYLRTYAAKDYTHIDGPMTSLQNLMSKRVKRKQIQWYVRS